jgi:putative ABC transport system permease protein
MRWRDTLRSGIEAILGHGLRSLLTILGIMIGIAAVILTVGLGEGAQSTVNSAISALGSNLLVVTPGSTTSAGGVRGGFGTASTLTLADANALGSKRVAPNVIAVAPQAQTVEVLTAGSTNWTTSVVGSTASWAEVRDRQVQEGGFFTRQQVSGADDVVVLGSTTASELFGVRSPIDQTITVNGISLTVIGVLATAGSSGSTDLDDMAIVPITTAQQQVFTGTFATSVSTIYCEADSSSGLSGAYQEIDDELLAAHHIAEPSEGDFTITSQTTIASTANSVNRTLTDLLAGIAGISLLVGGIGVMNIMLVSVTERVREIGLRKSLGAPPTDIRRQFLVEASSLGLLGGIGGVLVGLLGTVILPHLQSNPVSISPLATVGAVIVAIAIGLVFGVYPATRAARLSPIDALRSE